MIISQQKVLYKTIILITQWQYLIYSLHHSVRISVITIPNLDGSNEVILLRRETPKITITGIASLP